MNSDIFLDFNIEVDSNRIKLLPHWRLQIRKTPEDKNIHNNCEVIDCDDSSMPPRYVCPKSKIVNQRRGVNKLEKPIQSVLKLFYKLIVLHTIQNIMKHVS